MHSNRLSAFIGKQAVKFILLLIAISMMTFLLVAVSPIDPVKMNTGQAAYVNMSAEKRAQLEEYWGVDTPVTEKYVHWVNGVIHGDWGTSLRYNRPVTEVIGERFFNSLLLMITAWVLSGCFSSSFTAADTSGNSTGICAFPLFSVASRPATGQADCALHCPAPLRERSGPFLCA